MTSDKANSAVAKIVYRALMRWSRRHSDVPLSLRISEISSVLPVLPHKVSLRSSTAVAKLTSWAFRENRNLQGPAAYAAVDRGLQALRILNSHYAAQALDMRKTRAERQNRDGIAFEVGDVFVHKKFGYRAVIYGWDRTCERDDDWVQAMGVDPLLPHYFALPDERDSQKLFGGVRLSKYVCEENMMHVQGATQVVHRALENYFVGYSENLKRYIPRKSLQFEYPSVYSSTLFESLKPVDSNLLLHPESEDEDEKEREKGKVDAEKGKDGVVGNSAKAAKERSHNETTPVL
jgi:hemimethylated DNA binding protein